MVEGRVGGNGEGNEAADSLDAGNSVSIVENG